MMCFPREKTIADGFAEYILDCKARNLRDGTIHHYLNDIPMFAFTVSEVNSLELSGQV